MSISNLEISAVQKLLPDFSPHVIIVDVGGNKGEWTDIAIKDIGNYTVHIFEPNPRMLSYMEIKYENNERVKFCGKAAHSADNADMPFNCFKQNYNGLSSLGRYEKWKDLPQEIIRVQAITIDTHCEENAIPYIDILKIDVEGTEMDVLYGCSRLLEAKLIYYIQIEYSDHYHVGGYTGKHLIEWLNSVGYIVNSWDGTNWHELTPENLVEDFRLENFYAWPEKYTEKWNADFVKNTSRLGRFDLVIEIGCYQGLTTNYICDNLLKEGGRLIAIDPLEDEYLVDNVDDTAKEINNSLPQFKNQFEAFTKNTRRKPVELLRMPSDMAFLSIKDFRAGLIYIDGDHRREQVYKDCVNALMVCKVGGYVLMDDYNWTLNGERETAIGIDKFLAEYEGKYRLLLRESQVLIQKIVD